VKIVTPLLLVALFVTNPRAMFRSPRETVAREFVTNFAAGRLEAATKDFNEAMRATVTLPTLAELKQQIDEQVGPFVAVTDVWQGNDNGFPVIGLTCQYEKFPVSVRVSFDVNDRVAAIHANPIVPLPVASDLEAEARELLANFNAGLFNNVSRHFDTAMRAQLTPSKLAELHNKVTWRYGAFRSVTEVRQREERGLTAIELSTTFDKAPVMVRVVFDSKRRVAGLKIEPAPAR
jgi:hypothetical protein